MSVDPDFGRLAMKEMILLYPLATPFLDCLVRYAQMSTRFTGFGRDIATLEA